MQKCIQRSSWKDACVKIGGIIEYLLVIWLEDKSITPSQITGPIGYSVPVSAEDYWRNWLGNYGVITFGIAGVGLCLLIIGMRYLLKNRKMLT